jgi:hypothetical protein
VLRSSKWTFSFRFTHQDPVYISAHHRTLCSTYLIHLKFVTNNRYFVRSSNHEALNNAVFSIFPLLTLPEAQISSSAPSFQTSSASQTFQKVEYLIYTVAESRNLAIMNVFIVHERVPCWLYYLVTLEYVVKMHYKIIMYVRDWVSHMYKTAGNIIALSSSFFVPFRSKWKREYSGSGGSGHSPDLIWSWFCHVCTFDLLILFPDIWIWCIFKVFAVFMLWFLTAFCWWDMNMYLFFHHLLIILTRNQWN